MSCPPDKDDDCLEVGLSATSFGAMGRAACATCSWLRRETREIDDVFESDDAFLVICVWRSGDEGECTCSSVGIENDEKSLFIPISKSEAVRNCSCSIGSVEAHESSIAVPSA